MSKLKCLLIITILFSTVGCATMPPGPSVMVLPAQGKSFEDFQADDAVCRQWAENQTGWKANDTVNKNMAAGAAIGTALGAGLGAAIGSASGNMGAGAGIGAVSGLIGGTAVAGGPAQASGQSVQRRYDNAYQQCMYSKGNQIPGAVQQSNPTRYLPPPPPPGYDSVPSSPSGYDSVPPAPPASGTYSPPSNPY